MTVGPIRAQAADVIDLLADPTRCQVLLVTLPEETPVNEVVETAYSLEDRVGVNLAPVVINGLYPVLDGLEADPAAVAEEAGLSLRDDEVRVLREAADFRRRRQELQAVQVARLAQELPLPQLHLPFLFTTDLALGEVDLLAEALGRSVEALPASTMPTTTSAPTTEYGSRAMNRPTLMEPPELRRRFAATIKSRNGRQRGSRPQPMCSKRPASVSMPSPTAQARSRSCCRCETRVAALCAAGRARDAHGGIRRLGGRGAALHGRHARRGPQTLRWPTRRRSRWRARAATARWSSACWRPAPIPTRRFPAARRR